MPVFNDLVFYFFLFFFFFFLSAFRRDWRLRLQGSLRLFHSIVNSFYNRIDKSFNDRYWSETQFMLKLKPTKGFYSAHRTRSLMKLSWHKSGHQEHHHSIQSPSVCFILVSSWWFFTVIVSLANVRLLSG